MKLIGYIRVSTDEQAQGYGPKMQLNAIRRYCEAYGHELAAVCEDLGISGATMNRPGLAKMLEQVAQADGVVTYSVCRLSRDRIDTQVIVDRQLYPAGKSLHVVTMPVDISTEEGRLMVAMLAGFNQIERVRIAKRTTDGRAAKKAAGGYAGGRPGYGQRKCWVFDDRGNVIDKKLADDPAELQVLDLVRRHHRSGKTAYGITQYLNANGYTTKTGKSWTQVQVSRLLNR